MRIFKSISIMSLILSLGSVSHAESAEELNLEQVTHTAEFAGYTCDPDSVDLVEVPSLDEQGIRFKVLEGNLGEGLYKIMAKIQYEPQSVSRCTYSLIFTTDEELNLAIRQQELLTGQTETCEAAAVELQNMLAFFPYHFRAKPEWRVLIGLTAKDASTVCSGAPQVYGVFYVQ